MVEPAAPSATIEISYQKAGHFKALHVDGCFGGNSPKGLIHMAVYSERSPLPRSSQLQIKDGIPQHEIVTDTRTGLVRELEADLIMDLATAVSISAWLLAKSNETRKMLNVSDDIWQQMLNSVQG